MEESHLYHTHVVVVDRHRGKMLKLVKIMFVRTFILHYAGTIMFLLSQHISSYYSHFYIALLSCNTCFRL